MDELIETTNYTGAELALLIAPAPEGALGLPEGACYLAAYVNRDTGEVREQLLEGPFSSVWQRTAERKLRDMEPNDITPRKLVPSAS